MLKNKYPMLLSHIQSFPGKNGKEPYTQLKVVSHDDGDSIRLFSQENLNHLKRWESYLFEISISPSANGKIYYNLHSVEHIKK